MLLFSLLWGIFPLLTGHPAARGSDFRIPDPIKGGGSLPWEIQADSLEYFTDTDTYIATDGVMIRRGEIRLSADRVKLDRKNMTAVAEGNVVLTNGPDVLSGDRVELNLEAETGLVTNGGLFLRERHFHIRSDSLEKIGKDEFTAVNASITACDHAPPDWKITGRVIRARAGGYATVTHAVFHIRDTPVFYVPWFIFPIKTRRQSGLLFPSGGFSDRRGLEYAQPLYWAVNDHSDATFTPHFMSERGLRMAMEYRIRHSAADRAVIQLDLLDDRKTDNSGDGGYGYTDDAYTRPNRDRYWFRMKADALLPGEVAARLDLDWVSDQDYLKEFKGSSGGYDDTDTFFEQHFDRDLDYYDDPVRANHLSFRRVGEDSADYAGFLYYDDVTARRREDRDKTVHRLPYLRHRTGRRALSGTPFLWQMDADYDYFHRADGARGHRADIHPELIWPLFSGCPVWVESVAGWRQTLWYVARFDDGDTRDNRLPHRELPEFRVAAGTRLFRDWHHLRVTKADPKTEKKAAAAAVSPSAGPSPGPSPGPSIEKLRHELRPTLQYRFVPRASQTDIPVFDHHDRVAPESRFTAGLVQTLTARPEKNAAARRILRLELSQSLELNDYSDKDREMLALSPRNKDPEEDRHLSTFHGKLDWDAADFARISADAEWSHKKTRFKTRNISLSLTGGGGGHLFLEHRLNREAGESLYMTARSRAWRGCRVSLEYERDLEADSDIRTGLGLMYEAACWSANTLYTREEKDHSLGLWITLRGLGALGSD